MLPEFSFTYRLDPEPVQVSYAREQVRKILPGWGLAEYDDLLVLVVSELVTNAILHCDGSIKIHLSYDGNKMLIEIWDNSDATPARRDPCDDDETGRGLQLIDSLIEIYGGTRGTVKRDSVYGKIVFVSLSLPAGQPYAPLA